jgi:SAM-dependent methyltransferase
VNGHATHPAYIFDRGRVDQERLVRSADALARFVTEGCQRAGVAPGDRVIDIGCGPLGALLALANLVAPGGHVVGLDASGESLTLARSILDQRGCTNVTLVQAELGTVTNSQLCPPGPFDLAYMRRFLVHQPDPASTLRRIASLVRPGGRIVAHEIPPGTDYPALTPPVRALQRVCEILHAGIKARGGSHDAAHRLAALCRDAGVRLVSERGFVPAAQPVPLLDNWQAVLRSLRAVVVAHGVTTELEVADLLGELEAAKAAEYISAFGSLYIEMVSEVPSQ